MLFALPARARCGLEYFEGLGCCCSVGPWRQRFAYNRYARGRSIFQLAPAVRQHKCFLILKGLDIPVHRELFCDPLPKRKVHLPRWNIVPFWFFFGFSINFIFSKRISPNCFGEAILKVSPA